MRRNSMYWKRWVRLALGIVLVLDAVLLYANWSATGAGPQALARQRLDLRQQDKLLGADVRRVAAIRERLSDVQRQADQFYADEFLQPATGYSMIVADLNEISGKAGLHLSRVDFKERPLESRGVTEITVTTSVEGDYANLVRFINGLERTENFYLLENISLAASTAGSIKLNLQLRTYFRS
jgi:Tfp pilus assembly protein PilO